MKRIKLTNSKANKRNVQQSAFMITQSTNKQFTPKRSSHRDIEAMWTAIQKREKELVKKHSPQAQKQRAIITNFLHNHQINPQTGYIESKWNKKTHHVSCGSQVIK